MPTPTPGVYFGPPPTYSLAQAPVYDLGAIIVGTAATTSQTSADIYGQNFKGITVVLDTTAIGTGSITLTIQGRDSASGKYWTLLAGAAVTTNTTNVYTIYPGITATNNVSASSILPAWFRVLVTANNANAATYTVGAVLTT